MGMPTNTAMTAVVPPSQNANENVERSVGGAPENALNRDPCQDPGSSPVVPCGASSIGDSYGVKIRGHPSQLLGQRDAAVLPCNGTDHPTRAVDFPFQNARLACSGALDCITFRAKAGSGRHRATCQ